MPLKTIQIKKIKISDRFRVDMGNLNQLAESIKDKGILQPITVDAEYNLIAGGRRYAAAQLAELDKIPALIVDVTDRLGAKEIELLENVLRKDMTWHEECSLVAEICKLQEDLHGKGSKSRTAEILDKTNSWITKMTQLSRAVEKVPELSKCQTMEDAFKQIKKIEEELVIRELKKRQEEKLSTASDASDDNTIESSIEKETKPDIKWIRRADHNYKVGDAFEGLMQLEELQNNVNGAGTFEMIEVDPPYGIDLKNIKKGESANNLDRYTEVDADEYPIFLSRLCEHLYKCAADDAWVIFWYGPTWHTEVFNALRSAGFQVDDIPGIWTKNTGQTLSPELYLSRNYEPFAIARKGSPLIRKRGRSNVFNFPCVSPKEKYHPTQRPLELMREIISTFAYPTNKILVPFLGSGVTARAAYMEECHVTGWDLDENNKSRFLLQIENDVESGLLK